MDDTASRSTPQPDQDRHTLTVREVELLFAQAGVHRSHRHVIRLCKSGLLDAKPIPGPFGDQWYVTAESVPKAIGDLKQIDAQRARRALTQQATSGHVMPSAPGISESDTASHSTPQPDMSASETLAEREVTHPDKVGHSATDTDAQRGSGAAGTDTPRRAFDDFSIYEHPYVQKLEERNAKLEAKYEAQVRRTEEIQIQSQEKILELQRMTTVGQSKTLADFMLQAKEWCLIEGKEKSSESPTGQSFSHTSQN